MKRRLSCRITKLFAVFLVMLQIIAPNAFAKDDVLSLYKNKAEDNTPFQVVNMFPGDYITQEYNVRVSYNGEIKVYFHADVRDGYKELAEVLKCKIVLPDKNKLLYDGLMKDMPDLEHTLSAVNKTEDLKYEISVYLETSVGNEYKNKHLVADFRWWAYTKDEGYPGGGGIPSKPVTPPDDDTPVTPPDDTPVTPPDDTPVTPPDDTPVTPPDDTPVPPPDDTPVPPPDDTPVTPPDDTPVTPPDDTPVSPSDEAERPTGELIKPPATGDLSNPVLWIVLICLALFVILLIVFFRKKKGDGEREKNPIIKKLTICIVIIVILAICLCVTTFALVYSIVTVDENVFSTGTVEINLNNGDPIITENEFLFEPGMTVEKDFFIENESSDAVYYKIYFDNVFGDLQKVLDIKIVDKKAGKELYSGKVEDLTRENSLSAELSLNEQRELTAIFHYPEESGNDTQNKYLSFDLCAVATQKRNNPFGKFN